MAPMDDERPGGQEDLSATVTAMRAKPDARLERSIPVEGGSIELQVSAFEKNYFASLSTTVEIHQDSRGSGTYRDAAPKQAGRPVVDGLIPIEFRDETHSDGTGKGVGLNREFQVGDPAFDDGVYIDSAAPEAYLRAVLADETLRASLRSLVLVAHQSVRLNESGPKLELHMAQPWYETDRLQSAVDDLAIVRSRLPLFTATIKDARRTVDRFMPLVGLVAVMLTSLAGATKVWPVVDTAPLIYGILAGVVLLVPYAIVIWLLARGGPRSIRTFAIGTVPALLGLPLGTMGLVVLINGAQDPHPLASHEVQVVSRFSEGQASKKVHWLRVEDWRPGRDGAIRVQVEESLWTRVQEGQRVVVRAGPGRFGWTWVDGVGFASR